MTTLTVKHHFSAGHRIPGLPGVGAKCSNAHGHTFGVEVEIEPRVDEFLDFGVIKQKVRGWIDEHFDHGYIVWCDDDVMLPFLQDNDLKHYVLQGKPTTELIAETIYMVVFNMFPGCHVERVHVTEGPHNAATAYSG